MPNEDGTNQFTEVEKEAPPSPIAGDDSETVQPTSRWINLWERFRNGKLTHWLMAYVAAAYPLVHLIEFVLEPFGATHFLVRNLAVGAVVLAPLFMIIAWYHFERHMKGICPAEWGYLVAWVVGTAACFYLIDYHPPGILHEKNIVVVAVMSGAEPYEKIILDSFRHQAHTAIQEVGGTLIWKPQIDGFAVSSQSAAGREQWSRLIDDIRNRYQKSNVNYLVGVGTFASVALKNSDLGRKFNLDGVILLGVTDPVGAHLVEKITSRQESENIAVVRYGKDGRECGRQIANLFPKSQRLVFVYQADAPQDQYMAAELRAMGRFEEFRFDGQLRPADLPDTDAVYFAWYGFDNILNDASLGGAQLLNKRVIPSTCTQENVDSAGIVVSVDDTMVGKAGADIMWDSIKYKATHSAKRQNLGEIDVKEIDYQVWIDRDTVKNKKIKLAGQRKAGEKTTCPGLSETGKEK